MTKDRLDEIIKATAYPESMSVYQAVYQVENEMQQEFNSRKCENCKSFTEREDISHLCTMGNSCGIDEYGIPTVLRTWGCNEFERKEDA